MLIKKLLTRLLEETNGAGSDLGGTAGGESAGSSETNWDALDAEMDLLESDTPAEPAAPAAPASEMPPADVQSSPPAPAVQPASAEPAVPPAVAAPEPTTPAAPPPLAVEAPAATGDVPGAPTTAESFAQLRAAEETRLEGLYAQGIDEATAAQLLTEPEKVLPRLAARIHTQVLESAVNAIVGSLPQIMQSQVRAAQANTEAEQAFYGTWPDLNKPEYGNTVRQAVAAYKMMNPKAPRDEVIRAAGLTAMIHLRLPLPPGMLQEPPQSPPPATPFAPAAPQAGGFASPPVHQPETNPFSVLASELLADDRG